MEKSEKETTIKREGAEVTVIVTIPAEQVSESFQRIKNQALKEVEVPGFRKGKAPREVAEKRLNEEKMAQSLFQDLIPLAYAQTVSKEKLQPIIPPEISVKSFGKDKELVFEARTAEAPEVKLGEYRKEVSRLKGKELLGPDGKPLSGDGEATAGQVLEKLREKVQAEIPHILVDYEVQRMLSSLVDQVRSLGMTVDQYLSSQGKKAEEIQQEYHQVAERNLKDDSILQAVAAEEKIKVTAEEIEAAIEATPEEETKAKLREERGRAYLEDVLRKRKTIERLLDLAKGEGKRSKGEKSGGRRKK